MSVLNKWNEYLDKMKVGDFDKMDDLEFSPSRGDTHVLHLYLYKVEDKLYEFSIVTYPALASIMDFEMEEDENGDYINPETINGQDVRGLMGDYWVSESFENYPDENNVICFKDIAEHKVSDWLKSNGWSKLEEIDPFNKILDYGF